MAGAGVLVLGGGLIYVAPDGRRTIHARLADYLAEIRERSGHAVFASSYIKVAAATAPAHRPTGVRLEPLGSASAGTTLAAIGSSVATARKLRALVREVAGVVHFFPEAGGIPGSFVLAHADAALLTYLKSDWAAWSRSQHPGLSGRVRQSWWELSLRYELAHTGAVVARDAMMLDRLEANGRRPAEFAMPLLAIRPGRDRARRDPARDRIVFVGTVRPEKGLGELATAVARVRSDRPGVHVRVLGSAPASSSVAPLPPPWLRDQLDRLDLVDCFDFLGYVDDSRRIAAELLSADVFVLPSWSEGFPRVVDEALAVGLPVVATEVGGLRAQLADDEAVLVPPRDPDRLADAVTHVLADDVAWHRLAAAGRASYERRVTETAAAQHLRLLSRGRLT